MNKRFVRGFAIFAIIFACVFALTSCGKKGYNTSYSAAEASTPDKYDDAVDWAEIQIAEAIINIELEKIADEVELLGDSDADNVRREELTNKETELALLKTQVWDVVLNKNASNDYSAVVNKVNELVNIPGNSNLLKEKVVDIILEYTNYEYISGVTFKEKDDEKDIKNKLNKIYKNYKVNLIRADIQRYTGYKYNLEKNDWESVDFDNSVIGKTSDFSMLSTGVAETQDEVLKAKEARRDAFEKAFVTKSGCLSGGALTNRDAVKISEGNKENPYQNIYEVLVAFMVDVEMRLLEQEPISFQLTSVGEFFGNFFDNFFVFPVGWLLYFLSSIFGGSYIVGLFFTTILIRTAGWPIYAKTNDMSLKMQVIQPEMQKLEEKYANRQDPDSQRMKQAELAQIYRKNKIGIGGCFLPFLQFPIFMAVYGAVRRFPYTVATEGSMFNLDWANTTIFGKNMNPTLFGIPFNLFEDYTSGTGQLIGIIVLVLLVCGTQFLSQKLSEIRQKQNHQKSQEDIPAYRRQAYKQTNGQGQNTMKYVMYMMIFMMGTFVFTSKAGLGVYWLIGNLYSMLQTFLSNLMSQKKLAKMKEKAKNNR